VKPKTWRDIAAPIIYNIIQEVGTSDEKLLKKRLYEAYPFGERAYHPYKIWCDEIQRQTGKKKRRKKTVCDENKNQMKLF
jgi:hypothetical protein